MVTLHLTLSFRAEFLLLLLSEHVSRLDFLIVQFDNSLSFFRSAPSLSLSHSLSLFLCEMPVTSAAITLAFTADLLE